MELARMGLVVLGAIAITSTSVLVATRRGVPTTERANPLPGPAEGDRIDPASLAALVGSIERLIDAMERGSTNRPIGASPGPPRQPVTSSDEVGLAESLQRLDKRLVEIHAALLAGARSEADPTQRALQLRATVDTGPRPTNVNAWAEYFGRHPPRSTKDLPVELAVLGVADILERFGWPKRVSPPQSNASYWKLEYDSIEVSTVDGVVTRVDVVCTRDGTYNVDPHLQP